MLARVWKMIAANGVAAILFGFVLVLWPEIGLTTIVAVVAVYALVRGVLLEWRSRRRRAGAARMAAARSGRRDGDRHRAARLERHLREGAALRGGGLGDRHRRPHAGRGNPAPLSGGRLLLALNGIVAGAFGAVMFIEPDAGAVAIVALIATFTIVTGVMQIGFGARAAQARRDVRDRIPRPTAKPVDARLTNASGRQDWSAAGADSRRPPGHGDAYRHEVRVPRRGVLCRGADLHVQGGDASRGGGAGS